MENSSSGVERAYEEMKKLKDIEGLMDMFPQKHLYTELEIDVEKVASIIFNDALQSPTTMAQAIAKEFPVRVKK